MTRALSPGTGQRRVLFGALDPDGWTWAGLKAGFWFVAIIMLLGYIPDRAYYFTVNKTLDVGVMVWSPLNLCPGENRGLPCPVPAGAIVPWDLSPNELALPEGRADGAAAQLGKYLLYVGGDNGTAATTTTFVATLDKGNFGRWAAGPALPAARSGAGLVVLNGTAYLVGGSGPDGKPVATVWSLAADPATGALGAWTPVDATLPAARTGASVLAVSDGILVAGGAGADGAPTATVWKSTAAKDGKLGSFADQPALPLAVSFSSIAFDAGYVWVYGGADAKGAVGAVQRATYGAAPGASGTAAVEGVQRWAVSDAANLPVGRTGASGFTANGTLYLVGGSTGTAPATEVYWAVPTAAGDIAGWKHLDVTDLPAPGLAGASAVVSGSQVFVIGGKTDSGLLATSLRANLAPQSPFLQLGLLGATVPALQLPGEVGQQLGYLSAAGAGTVDFVLLLLIGWGFNHKPQVRAWVDRRRARRSGRAAGRAA